MQYRREIDGLRAVAVLPVILFHAGFDVFGGGYVGVDVFFVISGYLITSILVAELEKGDFSIARFYERRARRILPALFVVMFACLPFAYMLMLPSQLRDFAQSVVAVVFFSSNVLFWLEDGYFAAAAELKPLLHTWSLAVEEQYYLLFPVFLLLAWRFGRQRVFWFLIAVAAVSFLLAEWGWRNAPSANFYLAPARAWELLAGSACAFLTVGRAPRSSQVLSALGLSLIVGAVLAFDSTTPFPSVYALVPVAGTVLVILFATEGTWVARLLSLRGFVGIGLISYSAYLWHQPLFAFARLRSLTEPGHVVMGTLAVAALLLAWATWLWVEQPFRKRPKPVLATQRRVFVASGAVAAVFVGLSALVNGTGGMSGRLALRADVERDLTVRELASECFDRDLSGIGSSADLFCHRGALDDFGATVAVIGDSHALSFYGPLSEWGEQTAVRLLFSGVSSCVPFVDTFARRFDRRRDDCAVRNARTFTAEALQGVDAVVLIARWSTYGFGDVSGEMRPIGLTYDVPADSQNSIRVFDQQYPATLARLAELGIPVIVVHQAPLQEVEAIAVFQRAAVFGADEVELSGAVSLHREVHVDRFGGLQSAMESAASGIGGARVSFVDMTEALCDPICQIVRDGRAMYFDDDHLSNFGARQVFPMLRDLLEREIAR